MERKEKMYAIMHHAWVINRSIAMSLLQLGYMPIPPSITQLISVAARVHIVRFVGLQIRKTEAIAQTTKE